MNAIDIAKIARESVGEYCIKTCKAKCCQRGYLLLMSEKELKMICSNHKISYLKKEILKPSKNGFLMYDLIKKPCKHLNTKNFKCKDYLNVDKPKVCNDYPVFLINNYVMFASDCLAVQEGLLSKYEEEFKKINIKLI